MTNSRAHKYVIAIDPLDIDFMGHVNNASYLKWVQAAVIDHWRRVAPDTAIADYQWIAVKHEIIYRKPAYLADSLVALVVINKIQGARAFYTTVIKRGQEIVADVVSSWCCIDALTLRPVRLRDDVATLFLPTGVSASGE